MTHSGENKNLLSVKMLSEKLSVSEATVKNWIKLNKIFPSKTEKSQAYFTQEYSDNLIKELNSKKSNLLKSRRNKKYISGSFFYKDYLSKNSKNLKIISDLSDYITKKNIKLTKTQIKLIVADCAIQLLLQNQKIKTNTKNSLKKYLEKEFSLGIYDELINDLIENPNTALKFCDTHGEILKNYIYEKNEDILGLLYISLSNLNRRKATGAYYTPTKIVKKIINEIDFKNFADKTILDPCCGAGNFLLQLPAELNIEQIFGNDIDQTAIIITRLNMALKFKIKDTKILYKNFTNKNYLIDDFDKKFDLIIGNPPWGAEFEQVTTDKLQKKYICAKCKNIESYDVFIEKSLSCLNQDGDLFFVLPEAVLTVKNHENIRKIILKNNSVKYAEYLGNMFDKVQCPSIILGIKHTKTPFSCVGMKVKNKTQNFVIKKERKITPDAFNFSMDDEQYLTYKKIFSGEKIYLKDKAVFALGIVTGNNKKYITDKKTDSNEVVIKGSDLTKFKIKPAKNYIEYKPNDFQQTAPTEIYRAKEKLFYKFISKKLVFAYDDKQRLSLNSCNILIPQIKGLNIKYIMAILNSKAAQFVFEKKYNSVKVLRSHIEEIPIPICDEKTQNEIVKIVDEILSGSDKNYGILEEKICKLYGLNNNNL